MQPFDKQKVIFYGSHNYHPLFRPQPIIKPISRACFEPILSMIFMVKDKRFGFFACILSFIVYLSVAAVIFGGCVSEFSVK